MISWMDAYQIGAFLLLVVLIVFVVEPLVKD